jgi:hypothetical protein
VREAADTLPVRMQLRTVALDDYDSTLKERHGPAGGPAPHQ